MNETPKIAILLSTYNGAEYLPVQLESILQQSYGSFVIVARDDGSSDESLAILKQFEARAPGKMHLLSSDGENLGARGSFAVLVTYVLENKATLGMEAAYMMFCDQDDRWFTDKIATQMKAMLEAEKHLDQCEQGKPVMVHSDLRVVTEQEQLIAESLIRYQGLEIERNRFPNLVISNLVTGCTAMINEALARKAAPIPAEAIMHDWWLALVASAFGEVVFLDEALVHYRQHGNNTIGAKEFVKAEPAKLRFWRRLLAPAANEHLAEVARQAACFRQRFATELSNRDRLGLRLASFMAVRVGFVQRGFYRLARRF